MYVQFFVYTNVIMAMATTRWCSCSIAPDYATKYGEAYIDACRGVIVHRRNMVQCVCRLWVCMSRNNPIGKHLGVQNFHNKDIHLSVSRSMCTCAQTSMYTPPLVRGYQGKTLVCPCAHIHIQTVLTNILCNEEAATT